MTRNINRVVRGITKPALISSFLQYKFLNYYNGLFPTKPLPRPDSYDHNISINDHEFALKKATLASLPQKLTILVGKRCNLKCRMCNFAISGVSDPPGYLDEVWGQYTYLCKYLSMLFLNGGEPFIYKKSKDFVHYGLKHNNKMDIRITTNFNFVDDEWFDLISSGIIDLAISLDAATEQTYSFIRVNGDFNTVQSNLRRLNRSRHQRTTIQSNFIVMRSNYTEILNFLEFCLDHGINTVNFQKLKKSNWEPAFYHGQRVDNDNDLSKRVLDLLGEAKAFCAVNGIEFKSSDHALSRLAVPAVQNGEEAEDSDRLNWDCRSLWDHVSLSWERSNICCWSKPTYVFNTYNVERIWNSKLVRTARTHFSNKDYHKFCTPICPHYSSYLADGNHCS